jgi:hypothetical protein
MAAGEGIETVLSLRQIIAKDADGRGSLGRTSRSRLVPYNICAGSISSAIMIRPAMARAIVWWIGRIEAGIEAITLSPMLGDFNDDLTWARGLDALAGAGPGADSPPRMSAASWS